MIFQVAVPRIDFETMSSPIMTGQPFKSRQSTICPTRLADCFVLLSLVRAELISGSCVQLFTRSGQATVWHQNSLTKRNNSMLLQTGIMQSMSVMHILQNVWVACNMMRRDGQNRLCYITCSPYSFCWLSCNSVTVWRSLSQRNI